MILIPYNSHPPERLTCFFFLIKYSCNPPRGRGIFMLKKKGFTLIEMLVVVLIIGIIAAIAFPQYQKAVLKSRLALVQIAARNIYDALQSYYMANAKYPSQLNELDISFPGGSYVNENTLSFKKYTCTYFPKTSTSSTLSVYCITDSPRIGIRYMLRADGKAGSRYCITLSSPIAQNLCLDLGGKNPFDSGTGLIHYKL